MKATWLIAASLVAWVALGVPAADAEHLTLQPDAAGSAEQRLPSSEGRGTLDVDVDVTLDVDGFRLGGRVLGPRGVWGAWLNGTARRGGFTLDGRLQRPDRATNFKLDADIFERLLRGRAGSSL